MTKRKLTKKKLDEIRKRAETLIEKDPGPAESLSTQDFSTLVHELRIHQIELELQNEELRSSQTQLEEISDKYRELYDSAPVGYVTMDTDGLIQEINLRGADLLGAPRRLLMKRPFLQLVSKEHLPIFVDHRKALLRSRSLQTCELRLLTKGGKEFEALLESLPQLDEQGNVVSIRTAILDISERKQVERRLVEAERQFRTLSENAPDVIARFDKDLRYTYVNPAIEIHSKIPHMRFLGKTNEELGIPTRLTALWEASIRKVFQTGVREKIEFDYQAPGGSISFHAQAVPELNELGEVESVLTIVRDVSDLKQEQVKLWTILENAPVAIVVTDEACRLTMANQLAKEIYVRPVPLSQPVETHGDLGICYPDGTPYKPLDLPLSRAVFQGEVHENLEVNIVQPDGRMRALIVNTAPIKDPIGNIIGAVGAFKDVTELVEQREALRQARDDLELRVQERTADLVQAKQVLEVEVSERRRAEAIQKAHEEELEKVNRDLKKEIEKRKQFEKALRSATEAIIKEHNQRKALSGKLVELLEKDRREVAMALHDHAGQILTALKMDLESIEKHVNSRPALPRLNTAKDKSMELLSFIRNTSMELRPSTLDTLGLVASIRILIDNLPKVSQEKIHLHVGDLPHRLGQGVEIALYRIIQESLNNAIKYAQAGNIHVNLIPKGEKVLLLTIEDDGRGFDQNQEPSSTSRSSHLGLTIMEERTVLLGGSFEIDSSPGRGTLVMVEIPFGGM